MPSVTRQSTKKRQTRLVFSPLSSSSPAAAVRYTDATGIRATAQYHGSTTPSKRRRLDKGSDGASAEPEFADVITPPKSSNPTVMVTSPSRPSKVDKDASSLLPSPRRSSQVDRLGSSRGASTDSETASDNVPAKQVVSNVFGRRGHAGGVPKHHGGSSTSKSDKRVTDTKAQVIPKGQQKRKAKFKQSQIDLSTVPAGASSPPQADFGRTHARGVSSPIGLDDLSTQSAEDDIISTKATRNRLKKLPIAISSDDSDDENPGVESPLLKSTDTEVRRPSGNANASPDYLLSSEMDQADSEEKSTPPTRNSVSGEGAISSSVRQTRSMARTGPERVPDTIELGSPDEEVSDEEVVLSSPAKRRRRSIRTRKHIKNSPKDTEEDSEDNIQPSPIRRRTRLRHLVSAIGEGTTEQPTGPFPPLKSSSQQEQEDLDEDLEDLRSSSLQTGRTRVRVASVKKTEKQRQLELLRRRRGGEKIDDPASDSDQAALPKRALYDSDTIEQALSVVDEDDGFDAFEDSGIETVRQSLRADADDYDEDFVVEDDHTLGAPSEQEAMPLEFTRHSHKKAIEHFKDAIEWMVQKKLNPAFNRDDPVYRTAFFKLDDEVKGYSSSRFMSTAWGMNFSRALRARPVFNELEIPTLFDHKCDACNRSGHPAKYKITFGGKAYHHDSLEDISDDEEDEEGGDDAQSYDSRGNIIPSVSVEYFVGRFCKANAETAHALSHWRYHLNQWVLDWLQNEGYTTPQKILEREKWSIRKKRDYANEVVDTMEQKGEIRALYRDFKHNLEAARDAKPSRYRAR